MVCVYPPLFANALKTGSELITFAHVAKAGQPPCAMLSSIVAELVPSLRTSSLIPPSPHKILFSITGALALPVCVTFLMASPPAVPEPLTLLFPLKVTLFKTGSAPMFIMPPPPQGVVAPEVSVEIFPLNVTLVNVGLENSFNMPPPRRVALFPLKVTRFSVDWLLLLNMPPPPTEVLLEKSTSNNVGRFGSSAPGPPSV